MHTQTMPLCLSIASSQAWKLSLNIHLPGLEDKGEVLFPEKHPRNLPTDFFQVDVDNHQVCPFLIWIILHKRQVHHWLWAYLKNKNKNLYVCV